MGLTKIGAVLTAMLAFAGMAMGEDKPDLAQYVREGSGYIISTPETSFQTHSTWTQDTKLMAQVDMFDKEVARIQELLCGDNQNRSVLLIGEPNDTWRYFFARIATRKAENCDALSHVQVDISKIEAGHMYVGQVDEWWQNNVLEPADRKSAVLYLNNLDKLIGVGSHSNDNTGIESEYADNLTGGRLRSVAFIDKYAYQYFQRSLSSYVLEAFALKIEIPQVTTPQMQDFVKKYLAVMAPNFKIPEFEFSYLFKTSQYYQPNVSEPQRTMRVLKSVIRNAGAQTMVTEERTAKFESKHPYDASTKLDFTVEFPDAVEMKLKFDSFKTEANVDKFNIFDPKDTFYPIESYSGDKGAFESRWFKMNKLVLKFASDGQNQEDGFKMTKVIVKVPGTYSVKLADIRNAIFEIVQVPKWVLEKDYTVLKELPGKLEGDVISCQDSKRTLNKLARIGYITGRTDEKPIATHLFVGPTGTGKSYIAKRFADYMGMRLITLDMTSFRTPESMDRFLEIVADNLTLYPYAVYLFEEIDKANVEVLDRLYFMMDEGVFYDKYQRPLFARGAYILMTTNAAEDIILKEKNNPKLRELVDPELRKMFRASFLNRFDAIDLFLPFTDGEFMQLAQTMVTKKLKLLNEFQGWKVSVDADVIKYIGTYGRSARFGARPMERLVETVVAAGLSEYQVVHQPFDVGTKVRLTKGQKEHGFAVVVDGGQTLEYEVVPEFNDGSFLPRPMNSETQSLMKLFEAHRDFED